MATPLEQAVTIVGTQVGLAEAVGVTQKHVWNWLNRDKKAPADKCRAIERATKGRVTRYDLRPDVFGPAPELVGCEASAEARRETA